MLCLHCPRILDLNPEPKPLQGNRRWSCLTLTTFEGLMMKLSSKRLFLATIVLASCGYAAVASAQTAAPAPAGAQPQMQDKMHRGDHSSMRERMFGNHQERMAKRQAELKAKLKITPAQEGAWTTFTAAMKPPANMAGGMGMQHDPKVKAEMDKLTTPERIDKMQAMRAERMKTMGAEMDKRGAATKAFYAVLSSEQKAVFDAITPHGGRHGGMGGERGGRGEHGRMGHGG
jgi:periplasmic protein CpxP/Spy